MGLQEEIERLKGEIDAQVNTEEETPQEEVVAEEEKPIEAPAKEEEVKEESKVEEKPVEQPKEEVKEEEPKDNAAWQRLRREAAAAKKRAEAAETALEAAKAKPTEEILEEVTQPVITPEVQEMLQDHRMTRAEREFQSLEATFKAKTPEYEAVSTEYVMGLAQSIRIQNPRLTPLQVAEETKKSILVKAANYMKEGFDPIEELFHEAKDLGFTGQSLKRTQPKEEVEVKEEIKPDMKKVAANRARSTGMGATNGHSEGLLTKQAAADLSVAEWQKLPQAEKRRLLYG